MAKAKYYSFRTVFVLTPKDNHTYGTADATRQELLGKTNLYGIGITVMAQLPKTDLEITTRSGPWESTAKLDRQFLRSVLSGFGEIVSETVQGMKTVRNKTTWENVAPENL